jgi:hypothetical protein
MKATSFALFTCLIMAAPAATRANILLTVDISNPAAVVFSSTTAFADDTFLDVDSAFNGVTLLDFFSDNNQVIDTPLGAGAGTLDVFDSTDGTSRSSLVNIWVGTWPGGWTPDDISFYEPISEFDISFLSDARALTGEVTYGLSGFNGLGSNRMGNIVVGEPDSNSVIGQWQIVPVPGTAALLVLGMAGLFFSTKASRQRRFPD